MHRDAMFELRILTGAHAGARALLPDAPQVLGSGMDCDLILSDEGVLAQHATLERQEDGSTVLRWLDSDLPPLTIRPGEGAKVGPVQIAVDSSDAPWRDDVPLCAAPEDGASAELDALANSADDALAEDGTPAIVLEGAAPAKPPVAKTAWPRTVLKGAVAAMLVAAIAGGWWALARSSAQSTSAAAAAAAGIAAAAAANADPKAISKPVMELAARLGLTDRVVIQARAGQPLMVHAVLLTDDETEQLASALSRLSPRPGLTLLSEAELQLEVKTALETIANGQALKAKHMGAGRFRIEGRVKNETQGEELLARLAKAAPAARGFESALLTDAQSAEAMIEDLRRAGVPAITGQWSGEVLALEVTLAPSDVPRWEQLLLAVATRRQVPFRANLQLTENVSRAATLPFSVRSVVSSDMPYIVLADGRKLVTGASVGGWELIAIQSQRVVFKGADGRQLTLER